MTGSLNFVTRRSANGSESMRTHFSDLALRTISIRAPGGTCICLRPSQRTMADRPPLSISSAIRDRGLVTIGRANRACALFGTTRIASSAGSMAELSKVLERIRLIKGIANTETSILLASYR